MMASTLGMAVITENRINRAILAVTDFLGVNMAPIVFTEADYIHLHEEPDRPSNERLPGGNPAENGFPEA